MKTLIGWTLFVALLWFAALVGITVYLAQFESEPVRTLQVALLNWGPRLAEFIAAPLTLAIVLFIIFETAAGARIFEKIAVPSNWNFGNNIQALLAIVLIIAFAISAIGGVGNTLALKDIALVVVGFYFGSKKREETDQIAASAAAGAAAGASSGGVGVSSETSHEERDSGA
jgi:hypothetical protein